MAKDFYTIHELLQSANRVKGYEASSIAKKKLGTIYAFNKVLRVWPKQSIISVSMLIKGVTDMIGVGKAKKPVSAHRVQIKIRGVKNEEVTGEELVNRIRKEHPRLADKTKYSDFDLIERALKGITRGKNKGSNSSELLKGKVIMETNRVILEQVHPLHLVDHGDGTASYEKIPEEWKFAIIDKEISPNCEVQVKCTCSSYFWTFQYVNGMNNVDTAGKRALKSYTNYADSEVKRNPDNRVGICKHLMLMFGMLMHSKVIEEVQRGDESPASVFEMNLEKFRTSARMSKDAFNELVKDYKRDLRVKQTHRNARWYTPKKRTRSKFAPPPPKRPAVPKGTMGHRGRRKKK